MYCDAKESIHRYQEVLAGGFFQIFARVTLLQFSCSGNSNSSSNNNNSNNNNNNNNNNDNKVCNIGERFSKLKNLYSWCLISGANSRAVGLSSQPTPPGHVPPQVNKGLIAGLIKANHWLISPDHKALFLGGVR